jgi:L-iditol 2-dehydrogenase
MSSEMMRAALLYAVRDLRVEEVEKPEIDAGEVLARVKVATTCGTDLKIFQRGYLDKIIKMPTIFGHEWAGDIVEVAEGVERLKRGMRIRAGNSAPCFKCNMCQRGKHNLCEDMLWLWGAYAEYIRVPARTVKVNTLEIPPNVSYEEAAIAEPLACVIHGAEEANIKPGDTVAIIGAGPIGLLHLLVAKKMEAEKIIISDLSEERLRFAEKLGADLVVNAEEEDLVRETKKLTKGYGADIAIEAIGTPKTWEQALEAVRKGGTVLEFGGCPPGTEIKVNAELLHYGEVTIKGVFHATPNHFKKALDLITTGKIDVKPLVTRHVPLENIQDTFETMTSSKSDLKIAVHP